MIATPVLAKSSSPFADGANVIFGGTGGGKFIAVVAMIAIAGALNGWILLQGRAPLGAAKDGLFPKQFAQVDSKTGTPVYGIVISSVLITLLLCLNFQQKGSVVNLFTEVIIIATLTALIPYAFSAASEVYLLFTDRAAFSGANLTRSAVIATLAFAYSTWAIWGAGYKPIAEGFMLLLLGFPVYIWLKWQQYRSKPAASATTLAAVPASTDGEAAR
jgi:APA family basic amino acid/polyamine antiporter